MFILFISFYSINTFAQPCVPGNYTASGIYPDSVPGLPTAYVDSSYNTIITVVVPTDTFMFAQTLVIDSIGVYSVTGFPAGFAYSTNPTNGYIHGGASGCVLITGTPTLGQVGTYPINITMESWVNGIAQGFLDTKTAYYTINVTVPVNINKIESTTAEVFNYPNPFTKETTFYFTSSVSEQVSLSIYNNIGQVVYQQNIDAVKGENSQDVILNIADGLYFYTIAGKNTFLKNKMIISN